MYALVQGVTSNNTLAYIEVHNIELSMVAAEMYGREFVITVV